MLSPGIIRTETIKEELAPLREQLLNHPVYGSIRSIEDLHVFMEHHVFAVWDFMSLLKALQIRLTCTTLPWAPQGSPVSRRLINEIVLEEESDEGFRGGYASHYELYRDAMSQSGADIKPIETFLAGLGVDSLGEAMVLADVPSAAREFVATTWGQIQSNCLPVIAGSFTIGREDLIPGMFRSLIAKLNEQFPGRLARFHHYLERHINLDEQHHTPMAIRMLEEICAGRQDSWEQVLEAGRTSLEARVDLWNGVHQLLISGR